MHSDGVALPIALPEPRTRNEQDAEWCLVRLDGQWTELRFHDYGRIYDIDGLYERIFYDVLECKSPEVVCDLLVSELTAAGGDPASLRVLDLGAGNGIVAEQLRKLGAPSLVGVDILSEAAKAAQRDRPGIYEDYLVCDLTALTREQTERITALRLNALVCVAALGFGDIPPKAFQVAFDLIEDGGWVAFTIKEDFLTGRDSSGFSRLVEQISSDGTLHVVNRRRYEHRRATTGDPLHYIAIVGTKQRVIGAGRVD